MTANGRKDDEKIHHRRCRAGMLRFPPCLPLPPFSVPPSLPHTHTHTFPAPLQSRCRRARPVPRPSAACLPCPTIRTWHHLLPPNHTGRVPTHTRKCVTRSVRRRFRRLSCVFCAALCVFRGMTLVHTGPCRRRTDPPPPTCCAQRRSVQALRRLRLRRPCGACQRRLQRPPSLLPVSAASECTP